MLSKEPERIHHDWDAAVVAHCDFCSHSEMTVPHADGGKICASCCDAEALSNWQSYARDLATELISMSEQLAELKALPAIPKELFEIGELIRTQDNRITDQPFFAVMVKREIISSEDHDYDRICWVENQSGDYCEATDTQHRRLEAIYQAKYEVREGWDRYAMKEIDVFVTGCFTEQGCKDYISRNRHNMNKPFVYAFGSYRNNEYQVVRNFLQSLTAAKPAED